MTKIDELRAAGAWIDDVVQGLAEGFPDPEHLPFDVDEATAILGDIAQKAAASRFAYRAYMDAPANGPVLGDASLKPLARASNDADDALDEALAALGRRPSLWADDGVAP